MMTLRITTRIAFTGPVPVRAVVVAWPVPETHPELHVRLGTGMELAPAGLDLFLEREKLGKPGRVDLVEQSGEGWGAVLLEHGRVDRFVRVGVGLSGGVGQAA
jgi:hypothetical protein